MTDRQKYEKAKLAVQTWYERAKELEARLENNEDLEELEEENKELRKTVKKLRKDIVRLEEKHKSDLAKFERDKILYEGKIQQLEDSKKDLKERYDDLRQDLRDQQKWNKN
jgi:predicted  nucleic acid-binding Zn-ribbon protein